MSEQLGRVGIQTN